MQQSYWVLALLVGLEDAHECNTGTLTVYLATHWCNKYHSFGVQDRKTMMEESAKSWSFQFAPLVYRIRKSDIMWRVGGHLTKSELHWAMPIERMHSNLSSTGDLRSTVTHVVRQQGRAYTLLSINNKSNRSHLFKDE